MNNLPTKPGPYLYQPEDEIVYQAVQVEQLIPGQLHAYGIGLNGTNIQSMRKGQWKRIPRPDEGQEAWAVFHRNSQPIEISSVSSDDVKQSHMQFYKDSVSWEQMEMWGYTCKPVTIYPKDEE